MVVRKMTEVYQHKVGTSNSVHAGKYLDYNTKDKKAQLSLRKMHYSLQLLLQYRPSRSSKVNDFHVI